MKTAYTLVALAGAAAIGVASAAGAAAQGPAAGTVAAVLAEVKDAAGQVVLRGTFVADEDDDDDELEWEARLEATGVVPGASGSAEVEVPRAASGSQDIEFSVRGVDPGARFVFLIDGREIGSAVADRRGRVELEQKPGAVRR